MKSFLKRQKIVLFILIVILILITLLGLLITALNDNPNNEDIILWLEVIIIGLLINLVSSFIIIAFVEDRDKKNDIKRRDYLVKYVGFNNNKIKQGICATQEFFSKIKFEKSEEMEFFLNSLGENNVFLDYDYTLLSPRYNNVGVNTNQNGTWIDYLYHIIENSVENIAAFLPAYFPFLSIKLYNEINSYILDMKNKVLLWKKMDEDIVGAVNYSTSLNGRIMIINLIPTLIERIDNIDKLLIIE